MKNILITLMVFGGLAFAADDEKTIVCVLEGNSQEYSGYRSSREVKKSNIVKFNSEEVINFQSRFLSDYDFLENSIFTHHYENSNIEYLPRVTADEIIIDMTLKEAWTKNDSWNVSVGWYNNEFVINRKTGIGKQSVSIGFKLDEEVNRYSYVVTGDCENAENKF